MPVQVILDSNFLMIPAQFRMDIFEELESLLNQKVETIILSPVYEELQKIAAGKGIKRAKQAKIALRLAEKSQIFDVKSKPEEDVDDLLVRVAKEWKCPVATNDRKLRERLRDINVPVIYLRQRSHLKMSGAVF